MSKDQKKKSKKPKFPKKHPNFLFICVDEQRFQTAYENEDLKEWCKHNLKTQELLRENGLTFLNHYIGSTACSPSRATLFTGQYPSLHGVTQTTGVAKGAFDPDVYWLDPNTVPTLGDYFRAAGYRTFWKGKWHISDEDILIPGTHDALSSYNTSTGVPVHEKEQEYLNSNRLEPFGFSSWVGPEPHGTNPRNSGSVAATGISGRDVIYSEEVVQLIRSLEEDTIKIQEPWLIVSSFVNPHDITLFGLLTQFSPMFNFEVDPTIPHIPPAPTANESLQTKPTAQKSYQETYQIAFQPTFDTLFYRQLYYTLQKQVDQEISKVFQALKTSSFYENTIVVFTSDHGDLLGAHGGLFQKWHNAYEEALHVPFIIHSPKLFKGRQTSNMLTSHVDIIPTLLGLANINVNEVQEKLRTDHTEVHPFVGRNLTSFITGDSNLTQANEPLYFMTDDEVTKGLNQQSFTGQPYESVKQPNHLETVITTLKTGENNQEEKWKLSRYYDNPQFWSNPGVEDVRTVQQGNIPLPDDSVASVCITYTKTQPVPEQFELYNVTRDPFEEINLAHSDNETPESRIVQQILMGVLAEQRQLKRLSPNNG
ncbi:sulfatase-like hydrolase/transferase [Bacillus sp. Marseille-P3661]|uniref:sulfatase-like hydrolase/transferase n=1 Tax=Bacillus sp. Marseille-P3661 TaxID=1936234 RepID=UPI000C85FD2E|nr:sulfatase-like hydrolase/transferase [Bacillus sp. Marseille-P3661]